MLFFYFKGNKLKKYTALALIILNTGCSALINGQEQSVRLINAKEYIYMTTCSGLAETIGTCHQKAKRTCKNGYEVLNEKFDSSGVHREIRFQCKL
jgi:uncharacterized membrane protein YukC